MSVVFLTDAAAADPVSFLWQMLATAKTMNGVENRRRGAVSGGGGGAVNGKKEK